MFLIEYVRALLVVGGVLLALLGFNGMIYALSDLAWEPAFSAFLGVLFSFWIVNVGLTGRLSGRRQRIAVPLPNEEL